MDDETKLKLTLKRLKIIHQTASLEELAIKKIVKDINTYKQLDKLPCRLRNKILSLLTSQTGPHDENECESAFRALPLLLSQELNEIELHGLKQVHPLDEERKFINKILDLTAAHVLDIQALRCHLTKEEVMHFEAKLFKTVTKMQNLRQLVLLNGMVRYSNLRKVCKRLPSLRHLEANICFDCNLDDFDLGRFKASFSRLKVFLFRETEFETIRAETSGRLMNLFTHFCLLFMPNLEVVHNYADCYSPDESELGRPNHRLFWKRPALRHLCTVPVDENFLVNFPSVSHLKVIFELEKSYADREVDALLSFPKIESLTLVNAQSGDVVNAFLDVYGHDLRVLNIGNAKHPSLSLRFNSIFERCPKLETLLVDNVDMLDSSEEMRNFGELRDFEWNVPKERHHVCLSNVLSAPKLRRVSFSCRINLNSEDSQRLSRLIAEGKALRQLESLHIARNMFINLDSGHDSAFEETSNLIKNASAFLPKLRHVDAQLHFYGPKKWQTVVRIHQIENEISFMGSEERAAAAYSWLGDPYLDRFLKAYRDVFV